MKGDEKLGQEEILQVLKIRGSTSEVPANTHVYYGNCLLQAFANPEDALRNGGLQYYREDPDVERCRRQVRLSWHSQHTQGDPWQLLAKKQWEAKGLINQVITQMG